MVRFLLMVICLKNEDKTVLHLDREVSGNVRFIFDKRLEGEKYSEIAKNDERKRE